MTQISRTKQLARERLARNLRSLQDETTLEYHVKEIVPLAWKLLEDDIEVREKKVQVTLRLDESVAKFYRAMGPGYQARINRILGTWAQAKILRVNAMEAEMEEFMARPRKES